MAEEFKSRKGNFTVKREKVVRASAFVAGNIPVFNEDLELIDSGISILSVPSEITDESVLILLIDNANWNSNNVYNSTPISGYKKMDWYDDGMFLYLFTSTTKIIRIAYANL